MKTNLLRSFITITIFWWAVLLGYWIHSGTPNVLDFSSMKLWDLINSTFGVNLFPRYSDSVLTQFISIVQYWVLPMLILSWMGSKYGAYLADRLVEKKLKEIDERVKPLAPWRGVTITLGKIPVPDVSIKVDPVELPLPEHIAQTAREHEVALLNEMMSVIKYHESHYAGEQIDKPLLDYTLDILQEAMDIEDCTVAALIVAVMPELAKTVYWEPVYKKEPVQYLKIKHLANRYFKQSIKLENKVFTGKYKPNPIPFVKCMLMAISSLESWWQLDGVRRRAIVMAAKFKDKPHLLPDPDNGKEGFILASELLGMNLKVHSETQEKIAEAVVNKSNDPQGVVYEKFLEILSTARFQKPGLARGIKAIGWKRDGMIFLLEEQVRDRIKSVLDPVFYAGLKKKFPKKPKLNSITICLLDYMYRTNLLVTEKDGVQCTPDKALFKIKAGTSEFNGVMILQLNEDILARCPKENTTYQIEVIESYFKGAETGQELLLKTDDHLSSLLSGHIPTAAKEREKPKLIPADKSSRFSNVVSNKLLSKSTED